MGNIASIQCSFWCCSGITLPPVPKSDLFVPNFNAKEEISKKNNKRQKLIRGKVINKTKLNFSQMTTELFILNKQKIRNSFTANFQKSKEIQNALARNLTLITNKSHSKKNTYNLRANNNNHNYNNIKQVRLKKKMTFIDGKEKSKSLILKYNDKEKTIDPEPSKEVLSEKEKADISNIVLYHYIFHKSTKEHLNFLLKYIKLFEVEENSPIFCQKDEGSCMFIIKTGKVKLTSKNTKKVIILSGGQIFGELALMQDDIKRSYTATAHTDLSFYSIDKLVFGKIKKNYVEKSDLNFALFKFMKRKHKTYLQSLSNSLSIKPNQVITDLNGLFLIHSGTLNLCDLSGEVKEVYEKGDYLGISRYANNCDSILDSETKIVELTQEKSDMKIIAKDKVLCTVIPSFAFIEIFGVDFKNKLHYPFFKENIKKSLLFKEIFKNNTEKEISKLFNLKEYKKGQRLNTNIDDFKIMIIVHGMLSSDDNRSKQKFSEYEILGEEMFYTGQIYSYTVESNHLIVLESSWNIFKDNVKLLNSSLEETVNDLNTIHFFHNLNLINLICISNNLGIKYCEKNEKIIKKGDKVEYVYYIREGAVKFYEDGELFKEYHKGNSFGEIFILNGKPAKGEIISINKCELYLIKKEYFFDLLSDKELNKKTKKKLCLEDMEIFPINLYYLATLVKGKINNLYLVHNKIYVYIVKAIRIENYFQANAFDNCISIPNFLYEKEASKILDNPFLVRYVKTLKNQNWCFFVMEYINGISLSEYIKMHKHFGSMPLCKFQSACFMLMLEGLKKIGLIHRNIKPENIIIDKNGYPILIGFSYCKRINDSKTKTIIGTPHYMAPEIIKGRGYSYSCDYWSVGVLIYFLYYEEFPFGKENDNPNDIYKEIINKELEFKHEKCREELDLKELIAQLLNKDEILRFASIRKFKELNFYKDINFDKLFRKEIKAPFVPNVVNINFFKDLNNLRIQFNDFIINETIDKKNEKYANKRQTINNTKFKNELDLHKNIMKWYDQF